MTTTGEPVVRQGSLWRNTDFMTMWSGQIVSTLGARVTATALPLTVLAGSGSATAAGVVAAAGSAPYLLLHIPAGTLVDRWPRRRIMIISQLLATLALASIPVGWWLSGMNVIHLAVAAAVEGSCFVFYSLAERASIPRIVPAHQLAAALSQFEAKSRGAALAGPPLGGVLYGLGQSVPFLSGAIAYATAGLSLLFVRGDLQPHRSAPPSSLWHDTRTGLRWLLTNAFMRAAVLMIGASNLIFQALTLVLIVLVTDGGATPEAVGLVLGAYGAGGLLGAFAATRLHSRLSARTVVIGVNWVWAGLIPLLAVVHGPVLLGVIAACAAFLGPLWNVVLGCYELELVPNELLGRVHSVAMTLAWGMMPVGSVCAGLLLDGVGSGGAVIALSIAMLATAVISTLSPAIRRAPASALEGGPTRSTS